MSGRSTVLLALLALLAVSVAGCGSSGGDSSQTPTAHRYEGGEKSIENFGSEAEGSDRTDLLGAFHSYLEAIARRDFPSACSYLSVSVKRSLRQFAGEKPGVGGCAATLPHLLSPAAPAVARQQAGGKIAKVRVQGERAFVVFHAPGAKLYMLTMTREGGEWKAALVAASVLVPSAATFGQ